MVLVAENHQRLFSALDRPASSVFDAWQVHSADVVVADGPRNDRPHTKGDIILTDDPGVTLLMRFADCVPILLYDPHRRAIGIAHAGWLGTVRRAAGIAVQAMVQTFQSDPADILAGLGPSIGPDHYMVGEEVVEQIEASFGRDAGGSGSCRTDRGELRTGCLSPSRSQKWEDISGSLERKSGIVAGAGGSPNRSSPDLHSLPYQ